MVYGATRAGALSAILLAGSACIAIAGTQIVASNANARFRLLYDGNSTVELFAAGMVNGHACVGMSGVDGVYGAIAVRRTSNLELVQLPDDPLPTYEISGSVEHLRALELLEVAAPGPLLLSLSARAELGLDPGNPIASDQRSLDLGGTLDLARWTPEFERAGFSLGTAHGLFDRCLITFYRLREQDVLLAMTTLGPRSEGDVRLGQVNPDSGDPTQMYHGLSYSSPPWIGLGVLATSAAGAFIVFRARRGEYAFLLSLTWSRAAIAASAAMEAAIVSTMTVVLALLPMMLAAATADLYLDARLAFFSGLSLLGLVVPGTVLGAAAAVASVRSQMIMVYLRDRSG